MPECNRFICGKQTDGDLYCSDRCKQIATPNPNPDPHTEDYNRARIINNDR